MLSYIPHQITLPNGTRATIMARYSGGALDIVRLYLQPPGGEIRNIDLPTIDPDAIEALEYLRSRDSRFRLPGG